MMRYDQSVWAPNQAHISKRRVYGARLYAPGVKVERVAYGPTEVEKLDIYRTKQANAPIRVFLHGGAWRSGSASDSAYPAEMFVTAGAHYVGGRFRCRWRCERQPHADGRSGSARRGLGLQECRKLRRRSKPHLYRGTFFRCPSCRSGHGDGLGKDFALPPDIIKGGLLMSGMYDLKPVRLSKRSSYVKFTDEMEQALSTQRHLKAECAHHCEPTERWNRRSSSGRRASLSPP